MKDELLATLSQASIAQLALESLRCKDVARTLELLEIDLDSAVIALARLSKEVAPSDQERVTAMLQRIRDYRRIYPRKMEADLSSMASGLMARAGHHGGERAREVLDGIE